MRVFSTGRRAAVLLVLVACLAACGRDPVPRGSGDTAGDATGGTSGGGAPAKVNVIALADSVPWRNELGDGVLWRVQVGAGERIDTIPDVLTERLPERFGDTSVVGFRRQQDHVVGTFIYTPGREALRVFAAPDDIVSFGSPRFAPGGRHFAYLGRDSTGRGYGVVRSFPEGRVLWRGAPVVLLAADGGVDAIGWNHETGFTLGIALDSPPGRWQRTRGTIDVMGDVAVVVDTLATAP